MMALAVETIVISKPLIEGEITRLREEWRNIKPNPAQENFVEQMTKKGHRYGRIKALEWVLGMNLKK